MPNAKELVLSPDFHKKCAHAGLTLLKRGIFWLCFKISKFSERLQYPRSDLELIFSRQKMLDLDFSSMHDYLMYI